MVELVVLPGLDGTATLHARFSEMARRCFDSVEVVPYPTDRPFGYAALEELVRGRLPRKPFVLLGESFSGPIALSIASNPPPHLMGIVLSTTFAGPAIPAFSPLAPIIRFLPARAAPKPFLSWLLLGRWATGALEKSIRDALNMVVPGVLALRAAATLRPPPIDLGAISLPALYLRATEDRLLGRSVGESVRSSLPHCILRDIDGPHLLLQAAPEACVRAIEEFVQPLGITP